jgi:enoyl-CoA hydratase/3-hydroxyacyl-CoA dehydrogenase
MSSSTATAKTPADLVRLEKHDDIALITVDSPPVNSLSQKVVEGLAQRIEEANRDGAIKAVVLRGAGENFIAGADIGELGQASGKATDANLGRSLQGWLDQLEANTKPVVIAIDGFALGGGLEVAMAGHYRVGTTRCRVGLPELKLGLLPGAGGTQRLPRILCQKQPGLAGLQKAAQMMLESTEARGKEALDLGIVQELVEPEKLIDTAKAVARKLASGELKPIRASQLGDKLCTPAEAEQFRQMAAIMMGDKARNLVHPGLCLDAMLTGASEGYDVGIRREAENFAKCLAAPQATGLIHLFFATRAATKVPGVTDQGLQPRDFKKAAVLGGGTMGSGIATALLDAGLEVILKEVNDDFAAAGRGRIESNFQSRLKKGKLSQQKYDDNLSRLKVQTDYTGFDSLDIVIEAVVENIELKQQVFENLEKVTRPDCVLASNTSTIDLELIGQRTKAAPRILGTHFFSPAHVMPLVEIVRTAKTSPEVLNSVINLGKRIKKTPVTVGNCVGFLVNRIFFPYGQAAGLLVDHGVDPYRIDKAIYDFGMPMGPFRMADLAGVDVAKFAGGIMADAFKDRTYVSTLVDYLFEQKRFGQKTGKGYYLYPDGKKEQPDPELAILVEKARADAGNPQPLSIDDQEIVERVFFGVVNEACRCLHEGIAIRASDIDVACVLGMGFPPYRGGVMHWADSLGSTYIYDKLSTWSEQHGPIYAPSEYLRERAAKGKPLSE